MRKDTQDIRQAIDSEEFDYMALMSALQGYASPRDKITGLLERGDIIRVKKGLYVFGKKYARRPFSREILANLIYGPSYISLDYALNYYGFIPERVETITCMTTGRSRQFPTPVGLFTYQSIPSSAYFIGVTQIALEAGRSFLMATPEKALADKIYATRGGDIRTSSSLQTYLFDNLRVDPEALSKLLPARLDDIATLYRSKKIFILSALLSRFSKEEGKDE